MRTFPSALAAACLLSLPCAAAPPCAEGLALRTAKDIVLAVGKTPNLGRDSLCRFRRLGDGAYFDTFMGMRDIPLGELRASAPVRTPPLDALDGVMKGQDATVTFFYLAPPSPPPATPLPQEITFAAAGTETFVLPGCTVTGRVFTLRHLTARAQLAQSTWSALPDDEKAAAETTIGKEYRYVLHPDHAVVLLRQERRLPADDSRKPDWSGGERVIGAEGLCPAAPRTGG